MLVMDTDKSNFGLHTKPGIDSPTDYLNYFGGKKLLFDKAITIKKSLYLNELPRAYLSEPVEKYKKGHYSKRYYENIS